MLKISKIFLFLYLVFHCEYSDGQSGDLHVDRETKFSTNDSLISNLNQVIADDATNFSINLKNFTNSLTTYNDDLGEINTINTTTLTMMGFSNASFKSTVSEITNISLDLKLILGAENILVVHNSTVPIRNDPSTAKATDISMTMPLLITNLTLLESLVRPLTHLKSYIIPIKARNKNHSQAKIENKILNIPKTANTLNPPTLSSFRATTIQTTKSNFPLLIAGSNTTLNLTTAQTAVLYPTISDEYATKANDIVEINDFSIFPHKDAQIQSNKVAKNVTSSELSSPDSVTEKLNAVEKCVEHAQIQDLHRKIENQDAIIKHLLDKSTEHDYILRKSLHDHVDCENISDGVSKKQKRDDDIDSNTIADSAESSSLSLIKLPVQNLTHAPNNLQFTKKFGNSTIQTVMPILKLDGCSKRLSKLENLVVNLTYKIEMVHDLALMEKVDLESKIDHLFAQFENLTLKHTELENESQSIMSIYKNELKYNVAQMEKMAFDGTQRQEMLDVLYNGHVDMVGLQNQLKKNVSSLAKENIVLNGAVESHAIQLLNLTQQVCKSANDKLSMRLDISELKRGLYNYTVRSDKMATKLADTVNKLNHVPRYEDYVIIKNNLGAIKREILHMKTTEIAPILERSTGVAKTVQKLVQIFPQDCSMNWNYDGLTYKTGIYLIHPLLSKDIFQVYCDMSAPKAQTEVTVIEENNSELINKSSNTTAKQRHQRHARTSDIGNDRTHYWTVLQRRYNGEVNFTRTWEEYKNGFGDLNGEFWLGNERIYEITNQPNKSYILRIDMVTHFPLANSSKKKRVPSNGSETFPKYQATEIYRIEYESFRISNESTGYSLELGPEIMTNHEDRNHDGVLQANDCLRQFHNHMKFSTIDNDLDASSIDCAKFYSGGWWYSHCQKCNLNGRYGVGLVWYDTTAKEWLKINRVEMKIRQRF